jgi:hypothetical protein
LIESGIKILRILSIIRLILLKFNINLGLGSVNDHLHLCLIIIFFYFFYFKVLHEYLFFADLSFYTKPDVSICSTVNSFYLAFLATSFRINWGIKLELYILNNLLFYDKDYYVFFISFLCFENILCNTAT